MQVKNFGLTKHDVEMLEKACDKLEMSRSQFVRMVIRKEFSEMALVDPEGLDAQLRQNAGSKYLAGEISVPLNSVGDSNEKTK